MNEPIEDKAPKPPGLLPKHVQSWLIVGLAVLMVLIMWLTGSKKPRATSQAGAPALIPPPLVEVNEGKIAELQNRIEQLQREQLVAQNALTQQTRVLAAGAGETGPAVAPGTAPATERVEDPIETERKKRGYLSLFASNVALSYRKNPEVSSRSTAEPTSKSHAASWAPCCAPANPSALFLSSERHRESRGTRTGEKGGDPPCGRVRRSGDGHGEILRSL